MKKSILGLMFIWAVAFDGSAIAQTRPANCSPTTGECSEFRQVPPANHKTPKRNQRTLPKPQLNDGEIAECHDETNRRLCHIFRNGQLVRSQWLNYPLVNPKVVR